MAIDKIYEDAKDLHVADYILYAKKGDTKLYTDEAFKVQAGTATALECFNKGCLVKYDDGMYSPVSATVTSNVASLTIVVAGTASGGATPGNVLSFTAAKDE